MPTALATAPRRHTPSIDAELSGLRAQNRTFADTIAHQKPVIADLRSTVEQLRHQRKLHLGAHLAARSSIPMPMVDYSLIMTGSPPTNANCRPVS
jgi:hypothetical protein